MKKLDLYIIRKFLGTFFFSLILILCIVVIFDLSEKLERFIENEAPVKAIIFDYYQNFIPYFANVFSSLFTFISVIFFTSKMAYDSEIIAILSTGISFRRLVLPYLISAGVIAGLSFLLGAFIIPNANEKRIEFEKHYMGKRYSNTEQNIHRQIAPGTYIYMSSYSVVSNIGYDFAIENFRGDTLEKKLTSSRIVWDKEHRRWVIYNWKLREIDGEQENYQTGNRLDTIMPFQPSEFAENPKKIKEQLTLPELKEYIDRMKMRGSSNVIEFQIEKYKMTANAFATFILTLIGVSISSRKIRGGMGLHLGIGLLISFSYILFMQFSTVFATNGNMNPLLAVWLPNILFAIIGVFVYRTAPK
ncbi:LptF/LptG family permease [Odoribacter sp. Z80]|uniref:LptF/LptG family permease n=1 Tax=Odoribacter sp. Z80 TaxID=2304575 RepID=UPI00137A880F|nr:LptF/LptG family permease [Odoribacter sp. Z80]NCE71313.1 YjgP/YjgQ family permease [Odoribacter sp. Z80]